MDTTRIERRPQKPQQESPEEIARKKYATELMIGRARSSGESDFDRMKFLDDRKTKLTGWQESLTGGERKRFSADMEELEILKERNPEYEEEKKKKQLAAKEEKVRAAAMAKQQAKEREAEAQERQEKAETLRAKMGIQRAVSIPKKEETRAKTIFRETEAQRLAKIAKEFQEQATTQLEQKPKPSRKWWQFWK